MTKPAFWIWVLLAPTLTGVAIAALLMFPSLAATRGTWIVASAALSALVAAPLSLMIGKAMV
ncbi:MAG: hypothetical protein JNM69_39465 [Archangium sp.]|nr:hypothetical protein [Archangium sp.]MBM4777898.1 hypothetical protein [Archangiaceae bacterium]